MALLKKIEDKLKEIGLPGSVKITILGLILFGFATLLHETFHTVTALLLGCRAAILKAEILVGVSGFTCPYTGFDLYWRSIVIALAGPIGSLLAGIYFWATEPNGYARFLGLALILLSSWIQLTPWVPGTDGWKTWAEFHLNPIIPWILWLGTAHITFNLIGKELADERWKEWTK